MDGTALISAEEKDFLVSCVQQDFRIDGRACGDFREIVVQRDIVSGTHGSAQVKLSKTQILVGVKAELQEIDDDRGRIEVSVDVYGNNLTHSDSKNKDEVVQDLSSSLQRMINSSKIDLSGLCVVPGKYLWVLFVDVLVIEHDGNLLDAASIGVKAALQDVELPNLIVTREGDKIDVDVSDDHYDTRSLDVVNVPVIVTLSKIGDRFVVDTCLEEEHCVRAKVIMMVNKLGQICGIQKYGDSGLDPEYLTEMIEFGRTTGKDIVGLLEKPY